MQVDMSLPMSRSGYLCPKQSANGTNSQAQHHQLSRHAEAHGLCLLNECKVTIGKKSFQEFEEEICWRVEACLWVLVRISQSCINQATSEHLIRVLQKCYKVLTALTKHYLKPATVSPLNLFPAVPSLSSTSSGSGLSSLSAKGSMKGKTSTGVIQLPHGFLRVTQVAGMELSVHLYTFLSYFSLMDEERRNREHGRQANNGKKGGNKKGKGGHNGKDIMDDKGGLKNKQGAAAAAGRVGGAGGGSGGGGGAKSRQKAKILRESKLIPTLIYGVEQYERYVIQLSKKSKVNLTQFMRRSTARDFRIQIQRLGDLGLEDQYDEEQQIQQLQQQHEREQLQQEHQERMHQHEGGDVDMEGDDDDELAVLEEASGEDDEEEESLLRHHKRARRT